MPYYAVLLRGRHLQLRNRDGVGESGVYSWRAVAAPSRDLAVIEARRSLLSDPELIGELIDGSLECIAISVEEVRELESAGRDGGLVLYTDPDLPESM